MFIHNDPCVHVLLPVQHMSTNTGGPAFPVPGLHENDDYDGMTLRDYFAAKAMQGFAARDVFDPGLATPEQRAKLAYIEADAMLKVRGQI